MSDISFLSSQYEKLASTSDKVNNSVIILKKHNILQSSCSKHSPRLQLASSDVSTAIDLLIPFLQNLIKLMEDNSQDSDFIPSMIVNDYVSKLCKNQFMKENLEDLLKKLKDNSNLDENNIGIFDNILAVLDAERSKLFRELRTARG